jgi:Na+/proline symporter
MNLLTTADWLVIAAYFIVLYVVVFRHSAANRANPTEFFLAGRNAGWFIVGASIFATNIGSEHLVGLAGSGASGAFPAAQFELIAVFALLLLGWLFVPFYGRAFCSAHRSLPFGTGARTSTSCSGHLPPKGSVMRVARRSSPHS